MSRCTKNSPECYARAHDPKRCTCPDERPLSAAAELSEMATKLFAIADRDEFAVARVAYRRAAEMLNKRAVKLDKKTRVGT